MVFGKLGRRRTIAIALFACAAQVGAARAARATPPSDAEIQAARERFAAGRKLEDAGRWSEALTVFQRVAEVRTTPQVRFHIALCMENVGLWTQALDGYQQAIAEAGATAPDVIQEANEHLRKLAASIPTVTLAARGAQAGDEIHLDRRRVSIADGPLPIRADPGPHVAEVRRRGEVIAREYFALAPKATLRVELRVGEVAKEVTEPVAPTPVRPIEPGIAAPPAPAIAPSKSEGGAAQRAIGWSAVGLGGASFTLAGVFIGLRAGALSRLEAACPTLPRCSPSVSDIVAEGKRDAALVNVLAVVGGVAAATGITLLLTAPSPTSASSARVAVGAGRVWIEGTFR